jgi:hypothetical protein
VRETDTVVQNFDDQVEYSLLGMQMEYEECEQPEALRAAAIRR